MPTDLGYLPWLDLPKLKDAGVIPFAVGGDGGGWQVSLLANQLILSQLGAEAVEKIWKNKDLELAAGPEVLKAFATLKDLGTYADEGSPNRSWADTTFFVIQAKLPSMAMGDWAQANSRLSRPEAGRGLRLSAGAAGSRAEASVRIRRRHLRVPSSSRIRKSSALSSRSPR